MYHFIVHNLLLQSFVNDIYKYYGNGIRLNL